MARRIPYIPNRVIDTNGISDGATIDVFQTGTTTRVSIYSDEALTTPLANPYEVEAGAAVPMIYHNESGNIRVKITQDNGVTISDDDPFQAPVLDAKLASSEGAAQMGTAQGVSAQTMFNRLAALGGVYAVDYASLQDAVNYAQANDLGYVVLGPGDTELSSTVTLGTQGIAIIGNGYITPEQSGTNDIKPSQIVWTGGSTPIFSSSVTRGMFQGFAVRNEGTATDFVEFNAGSQAYQYRDLSFVVLDGATHFTRSIIRSNGNRLGYTQIDRVNVKSAAPAFIDLDGQGTANGNTWISIRNSFFDSTSTQGMTVFKSVDELTERLMFRNCTFIVNSPGFEMSIVDTETSATGSTINVLSIEDCELDQAPAGTATWRFIKAKNVDNITFNRNHVNGGGAITAIGRLTNSHLTSCEGNFVRAVSGPWFEPDATSTIQVGSNFPDNSNSANVFTTRSAGVEELPYAATINVALKHGNLRHHLFEVDVTNASNFTLTFRNQSGYAFPVPGTLFTYMIRNVSGGVMGASQIRFNSTHNLVGGGVTLGVSPADGFQRAITFMWDGTKAVELYRSAGDVANA